MSNLAKRRLAREAANLRQAWGADGLYAAPRPDNIFEFHFVFKGPANTPYEHGWYHGLLRFPKSYPNKPPSVLMLTPSGRFEVNQRLCLSISDFHPESWSPVWSADSIIRGLISFMVSEEVTAGSVTATEGHRRQLARVSMSVNTTHRVFRELFPDVIELAGAVAEPVKTPVTQPETSAASPRTAAQPDPPTATQRSPKNENGWAVAVIAIGLALAAMWMKSVHGDAAWDV